MADRVFITYRESETGDMFDLGSVALTIPVDIEFVDGRWIAQTGYADPTMPGPWTAEAPTRDAALIRLLAERLAVEL